MDEEREESPLKETLSKLNRSRKGINHEDIWRLGNMIADIVREEKEITLEELSAKAGISTYWIRKVWDAVGDYFEDIDIVDGRKFFVLKKSRGAEEKG